MIKLPDKFEDKMRKLLGNEYEEYISCYSEPRKYGLRVNTLKISVEDFKKICPFKIDDIPWIENGFTYDGDLIRPAMDPYYYAGLYYLQEPSAMTPANRLDVRPGEKVLDLCAAPGGKATELGARLNKSGVLVANDISSSRAMGLLKNIELFGIPNAFVLSESPEKLSGIFPEYFDKILIDAPCSGEGMFRKDKKMIKSWQERGPEFFSVIQKDIINSAYKMLKPGGRILYSTCTFDSSENEEIIGSFLEGHSDMYLEPIIPYKGFSKGRPGLYKDIKDLEKTVRIFPHKMQGEGHFLALMKKEDSLTKNKKKVKEKKTNIGDEAKNFLSKVKMPYDGEIVLHDSLVYLVPKSMPKIKGLRFLRTGLFLGEIKKKRFDPSQALAMSITKDDFTNVIDLKRDDEKVIRYLKGETLIFDENIEKGWCLICVDGYPLGWGKASNKTVKNKYSAGWRWMGV